MPGRAQEKPDDWFETRMRLQDEYFESDLAHAGISDHSDDDDDPDGVLADARWDKIDALISANPAEAVRRWRQLWEKRARGEKNKDLKELSDHIAGFAELEEYTGPDDVSGTDEVGRRMRTFRDLYRAGLCEVCTLIVQEDDFFKERENWVREIIRIVGAVIQWGGTIETEDLGNWSGLPAIIKLARATCTTAWANRERLLQNERSNAYGSHNHLRMSVAQVLFEIFLLTDEKATYRTQVWKLKVDVRRLAFYVWIVGSPPNELNRAILGRDMIVPPGLADTLLSNVLTTFIEDPDDPRERNHDSRLDDFIRQEILEVYGAEQFLTRINASLREAQLGIRLESILSSLSEFAVFPSITPHLQTYGTYLAIREACNRQALQGTQEIDNCRVLANALWIYRRTFTHQPPSEIAYIVKNCNVIELIARYVRLYALLGHEMATTGTDASKPLLIVMMYGNFAVATNMRSGKNTLRKTMRNTLRQDWYPTLHVLHSQRDDKLWRGKYRKHLADLTEVWTALGTAIALEEETEKRDYERELKRWSMVCAWKECKYHNEKPPTPLNHCKGCREVKYCSLACQKKDWREGEHKARCRKITSSA
ncbi:unnamed protein product [Peniophora sp. CBMAI 1063]|nr:unnamed protein product [Peniophora sp. CBMAI 1063]